MNKHCTLLNNIQTQHAAHINETEKLVHGGIYLTYILVVRLPPLNHWVVLWQNYERPIELWYIEIIFPPIAGLLFGYHNMTKIEKESVVQKSKEIGFFTKNWSFQINCTIAGC